MNKPNWLLLIINLPGQNQTLRMRIWRAMKVAGAAALRDGVYLLPTSEQAQETFATQTRDIEVAGGSSYVVRFVSEDAEQQAKLVSFFDRAPNYAELLKQIDAFKHRLAKCDETEARRQLISVQREATALIAIDFFAGEARSQLEQTLADLKSALNTLYSADEPHATRRKISRRDRKSFQGRTWATRERLWVDRVCSAWLIRRFIDPKAKFIWLKRIKDCPKRALGFDFDGAEFTHVDGKVTFEVLLASFGLQADAALTQFGNLVHFLDVGGIPAPEANGFAAILTGIRAKHADDDAFIKAAFPVIDHLYASYAVQAD